MVSPTWPEAPMTTTRTVELACVLPRRGAAVDDERLALDERGGVGGEEHGGIRDLVHLAPAADADAVGDGLVGLLALGPALLEHVDVALGHDGAGRDAVDPDALASPRHGQLAGERDDRALGRAVVGHHRRAVDAGDGGDVDDGALTAPEHVTARPLAPEEHAVEV